MEHSLTKLQNIISTEIQMMLNSLGFVDLKADYSEVEEAEKVFSSDFLDNSEAQSKETYLVYSFKQVNEKINADNEVIFIQVPVYFDLFTTLEDEGEKSYNIREELEYRLKENKWKLDFMVKSYDTKVKLWHYTFAYFKVYG